MTPEERTEALKSIQLDISRSFEESRKLENQSYDLSHKAREHKKQWEEACKRRLMLVRPDLSELAEKVRTLQNNLCLARVELMNACKGDGTGYGDHGADWSHMFRDLLRT